MTVQARETRRRTGRRRRVLTALLALGILIPLGLLFLAHNGHLSERRSAATEERHGLEYLLALGQLTIALTDAQSAAVSGDPVPREALDESLADTAEADDRLGADLRVQERWLQLRDTIERTASTEHGGGRAAYSAYEEATSLLLDLQARLRETAGLVRDPDQDANHLQGAAGQALPETIVATGQLVDLVTISADATEISAAVAAVESPVDDLVVGVQAALDTTSSRSLSSTVLTKYDRFLRAKDALLTTVPPDGNVQDIDLGPVTGIRGELWAAADDLSTALLTELDALIETRASELARGQWITVASVLVGVLLVCGLTAAGPVWDLREARQDEPQPGSGGDERGGTSGAGRGAQELPPTRIPISDTAGGYDPRPGTPPGGNRLTGELLGSERADVR